VEQIIGLKHSLLASSWKQFVESSGTTHDERITHVQTSRSWIYAYANAHMHKVNVDFLKHSFRFIASWRVKCFHFSIPGDRFLGLYFLHHIWLGLVLYLHNFLPELLKDVVLQTGSHLRFMLNGTPSQFLLAVRGFLYNEAQRLVLLIHLWEHLNSTVYATDVDDVQVL
jgi:hypothetical protein